MKAIITLQTWASDLVTTIWTPLFVAAFVAIVLYALWPSHKKKFDDAAQTPLRED